MEFQPLRPRGSCGGPHSSRGDGGRVESTGLAVEEICCPLGDGGKEGMDERVIL